SNTEHGLARSNEDKWKAVTLIVELCPNWAENRMATHCGVSPNFVKKVKAEYNREHGRNSDGVEIRLNSDGHPFKHTPRSKSANTAGRDLAGQEAPSVGAQLRREPESASPVGSAGQSAATATWTMYDVGLGDGAAGKEGESAGEAPSLTHVDTGAGQAAAAPTASVGGGAAFDWAERVDRPQVRQRAAVGDEVQVHFTTAGGDPAEFMFNLQQPDATALPQRIWSLKRVMSLLQELRANGVSAAAITAIVDYVWADAGDESTGNY
ncbi:hypothetical protein D4Q85_00945, partial [bacterium]